MATDHTFFAGVRNGAVMDYRHVKVKQGVQDTLGETFEEQLKDFWGDRSFVPFDGGYSPSEDELSEIKDFALPEDIAQVVASNANLEHLKASDLSTQLLRSFFSVMRTKEVVIGFQGLTRARVVTSSRLNFILSEDTLQRLVDPGLTLQDQITAVYANKNLYFRSYRSTQGFLDLTEYFREASDADIKEFLDSEPIRVTDKAKFEANLDSSTRKRLYYIKQSKILDKIEPKTVVSVARHYGLKVDTHKSGKQLQLVFPERKEEFKKFLRILADDILQSRLTKESYVSNSKRKLTPTGNGA